MSQLIDTPAFILGTSPEREVLLRFLPPLPDGVVQQWLVNNLPLGSWVLDPFGAAPRLTVEAARAGYRVVVAANNPIARFLIETQAAPPTQADLQAALSHLAGARVGEARLEPYIQSLYETECENCDLRITADAYIWERNNPLPLATRYSCPHCGHQGEFPANSADFALARKIGATIELHRSRALERVTPRDDPDRQHAEEALAVYLPRAVQVLFTLVNKLDSLEATPDQINHLRLLLLMAFDQGNSLWAADGSRARPRQLSLPGTFIERNIWKAIETGIQFWKTTSTPVPIYPWSGTLPAIDGPGLVLFDGPVRDLADKIPMDKIRGIIAPIPRPNQAFWTLSALWAGWLWGREAAGPFKMVLRRRRYDWNWHTGALFSAFQSLKPRLKAEIPCFQLIAEYEPGLFEACLLATNLNSFRLSGMTLRNQIDQAQLYWSFHTGQASHTEKMETNQRLIQAARNFILNQGEPVPFSTLQAACLGVLAEEELPISEEEIDTGQALPRINSLLQDNLTLRNGFIRYGGTAGLMESGFWWVEDASGAGEPLADRVEMLLVNQLIKGQALQIRELDQLACQSFRGLHTPEPGLVEAIISSYAEPATLEPDGYRLRSEDAPLQRREDIQHIRRALEDSGKQLGFQVQGEQPLLWISPDGVTRWVFYILASAIFGKYLTHKLPAGAQGVIVLPGGRANLVLHKLKRNPHLNQAFQAGWFFLKFRHVLRLKENSTLTAEAFPEFIQLDPLTYSAPQMRLF
jgi:hypothetical protein